MKTKTTAHEAYSEDIHNLFRSSSFSAARIYTITIYFALCTVHRLDMPKIFYHSGFPVLQHCLNVYDVYV